MTDLLILAWQVYAVIFLIYLLVHFISKRPNPVPVASYGVSSVYLALFVVGMYILIKFLL